MNEPNVLTTEQVIRKLCSEYGADVEKSLRGVEGPHKPAALRQPCRLEQVLTPFALERYGLIAGYVVRIGNALRPSHVIGVVSNRDVLTGGNRRYVIFQTKVEAARRPSALAVGEPG